MAADRVGEDLADRLRAVVGAEQVLTHPDRLATYASDGLLQYAQRPGVVVLPGGSRAALARGSRAARRLLSLPAASLDNRSLR